MFNERIPYNPTVLAQVTRHNVGVIEKALKNISRVRIDRYFRQRCYIYA